MTIPALRARPHDLPLLIAGEIAAASRRLKKQIKGLDSVASERLIAYPWPGNLRELSRMIHTAVALTRTEIIPAEALLLQESFSTFTLDRAETLSPATIATGKGDNHNSLKAAERQHILRILAQVGGNKRRAAKALGISRSTLDRKLV